MDLVKCPSCVKEIENDSFYCDLCGEELKVCSKHGFKKGKVCSECGTKLTEAKSAGINPTPQIVVQPTTPPLPLSSNENLQSAAVATPATSNPDATACDLVDNLKTIRMVDEPVFLQGIELNARLELKNGAIIGRTTGDYLHVFGNQGYISGTHAQINKNSNKKWEIVDKNSSNGTFLNDKKLTPNQPEEFKIGDTITFYNVKFTVTS